MISKCGLVSLYEEGEVSVGDRAERGRFVIGSLWRTCNDARIM